MKKFAVSVFDRAVDAYSDPVFVSHPAAAIRGFRDALKSEDSQMFAHPEDFSLRLVGHFDLERGTFINCDPQVLFDGSQIRNEVSDE